MRVGGEILKLQRRCVSSCHRDVITTARLRKTEEVEELNTNSCNNCGPLGLEFGVDGDRIGSDL